MKMLITLLLLLLIPEANGVPIDTGRYFSGSLHLVSVKWLPHLADNGAFATKMESLRTALEVRLPIVSFGTWKLIIVIIKRLIS